MKEKKRIEEEDVIMEAEIRVIPCEQNLISLKKKEQDHQRMQTAFRNWKRQGNVFSLRASRKKLSTPT